MKFAFTKGSTSRILTVFIQDSSSATGAGLASLDHTSGIVGGYVRMGSTGVALAVDEDVAVEGTYQAPSTAAHVRIGTPANMRTGTYELHFHDSLYAAGADALTITLGGATNMADLPIEIQLTGMDLNDAASGGMTALADWLDGERLDLLLDGVKNRTDNLPDDPADDSDIDTQLAAIAGYVDTEITAIQSAIAGLLTTQMSESYAAKGVVPTPAQILFEMRALLAEMTKSGTTLTTKKIDGASTAATYTYDAESPSSVTRAT